MKPGRAERKLSRDMANKYAANGDLSSQAAVVNAPTRSLSVQVNRACKRPDRSQCPKFCKLSEPKRPEETLRVWAYKGDPS